MPRYMNYPTRPASRRGALLLVVLSILVLFSLVGLTFVVAAMSFRGAADANLRSDITRNDAALDADNIALQLLRGPRAGTGSSLLGHDLLRDIYGNGSVVVDPSITPPPTTPPTPPAAVAINTSPGGVEQIWRIRVTNPPAELHQIDDYYTGSVLTFTNGDAKGQSHRILRYRLDWSGNTLNHVDFIIDRDPDNARFHAGGTSFPTSGASFVVNDPPFNGTGYGYDPRQNGTNKRSLDLADGDNHGVAYVPHIAHAYPSGTITIGSGGGSKTISIEAGGADEAYDAPDQQNMFLSFVPLDGTPTTADILPAFHRQDLIRFWVTALAADDPSGFGALSPDDRTRLFRDPNTTSLDGTPSPAVRDTVKEIRRKIMLRPLQQDHPNFTGSNPNFDPFGTATNAVWDIDNDLDGIPDSIWIDPGLPLKTDRQGRRYKALAAILVKDMDGLVNVNAHGFYSHLREFSAGLTDPDVTVNRPWDTVTHAAYSPAWSGAGTASGMVLPRGSGYGPADVSLFEIFSNATEAYKLMHQRYLGVNKTDLAHPGIKGTDDVRSRMATLGVPNDYNTRAGNIFGTPPDRLGIGQTYFDYAGRPRFQTSTRSTDQTQPEPGWGISPGFYNTADDPYETNLVQREPTDGLFTYQELERVVRYEEFDSSQVGDGSDRLLETAPNALRGNDPNKRRNRRLITTASFQVPTAGRVDIPHDLRNEDVGGGPPASPQNILLGRKSDESRRPAPTLVALAQERLRRESATPLTREQLRNAVRQLLPPEILRGEPLDINRLLESPPATGTETVFQLQTQLVQAFQTTSDNTENLTPESRFVNSWFRETPTVDRGRIRIPTPPGWASPDPSSPTSYSMTRQLMARHLYVMMLLLLEADYTFPTYRDVAGAGSYTPEERRELTRQRIAQWAINVVDFRDKDAIMTPFEYDLEPFIDTNGDGVFWEVNGDLGDNANEPNRRVVWGAEAPDLVITETLAFHDRRTMDTAWDSSQETTDEGDPHLDQYRIPQGSLFLEFYNPRNVLANNPASSLPRELYNDSGYLHLNRRAVNNTGDPVWRVLIVNREDETGTPSSIAKEMVRPDGLDTINFQPRPSTGIPGEQGTAVPNAGLKMLQSGANENYEIDRIIYFADYGTAANRDREFRYRGSNDVLLQPDHYFVVAPRKVTHIGSKIAADPDVDGTNENASYHFEIMGPDPSLGVLQFRRNTAANDYPIPYPVDPAVKPNVAIAVTMDLPDTSVWPAQRDPDGAPAGIGLNISEPLRNNYYPEPSHQNPADGTGPYSYYGDDTSLSIPNVPFETDNPDAGRENYPLNDEDSAIPNLYQTGTHPQPGGGANSAQGYKTAVLQRLANPLSNFDATYNPYITVDWMPIDLTVFNGEDYYADEDDRTVRFNSRERGRRNPNSNGNLLGVFNQINPEVINTPDLLTDGTDGMRQARPTIETPRDPARFPDEHFARPLIHTLGYVNRTMGVPMNTGTTVSGVNINGTYTGAPLPDDPSYVPNPITPAPQQVYNNPFTWLHWANAPYVSEFDLMMVPTSSPQRLLFEYSLSSGVDPYNAEGTDEEKLQRFRGLYAYLFNFFHSNNTDNTSLADKSAQLVRLFDFIHVPSRFNGTNKWFSVSGTNHFNPDPSQFNNDDPRNGYLFPFNRRSMFREPGKINLNTIPSKQVYDSIFEENFWQNGAFNFPDWDAFQRSRRGFYGTPAHFFPSRFSNPFRTAATAEMMPSLPNSTEANAPDVDRLKLPPAEATLLRSEDPTSTNKRPLFDLTLTNAGLDNPTVRHYRANENPMLRYQAYQRLGNIAGTQSNVFAVWITIGYFEVEPHAVDAQHPDGWALGQELGSDTGQIQRHRAFYIIDRSVPVGYLPGEDLNVEQAIMLRRFIE